MTASHLLWTIEGLGKLLLFASFWYLTPVVIGPERLRAFTTRSLTRWTSVLLTLIVLYLIGFLAVLLDSRLPEQFRFTADIPPLPQPLTPEQLSEMEARNQHAKELAAKQGWPALTVSPELLEANRWLEWRKRQQELLLNRVIAIGIMLGLAATLVAVGRSAIERFWVIPILQMPNDDSEESKIKTHLAVIGAGLFALGSVLDFIKWISSYPGS